MAPIRQDTAMTGSLSVRGHVLPVGGVTFKIEAAIKAGIRRVIVPWLNLDDIHLTEDLIGKIEIIPVKTFPEVLKEIFIPEFAHLSETFEHIHKNEAVLDLIEKTSIRRNQGQSSPTG